MSGCCFDCHFKWEEREVLPLLPPEDRARLLREHAELERAGYPPAAVLLHAANEMVCFRRNGVPRALFDKAAADHVKLEKKGR